MIINTSDNHRYELKDQVSGFIDYTQRLIFVVLLAIGLLPKAYAAEGTVSIDKLYKTYMTTAVEPGNVRYSYIPGDSEESLAHINEDIKKVYPIGTPGFLAFNNAVWIVTSDGIVMVQLGLPRSEELKEKIILTGTWETQDGITRLHMYGTGLYGLQVTLDGLLQPRQEGWYMDGLFTATVRGARHIEGVRLLLEQASLPALNEWEVTNLEGFRQSRELEQSRHSDDRQILSEPAEWIGGVPLPTDFDTELKVKIDGVELEPMSGQLLLSRANGDDGSTIALTFVTEGPVVNGWSGWVIDPGSGKNSQSNLTVTVVNGEVHADISKVTGFQQLSWWIQKTESPDEIVAVLADEAEVDIKINGDKVVGTINAKGRIQEGDHPVSIFSATLSGARQAGNFLKEIGSFVGARPFDGLWNADMFGELKLSQSEKNVIGECSHGYTFKGTVEGSILDFAWKSDAGKNGSGFLSSVGSGILVGMMWENDQSANSQSIVAIQSLTGINQENQLSSVVPVPTNDAEAMELKNLGYDLNSAKKYREATRILEKVVAYYAGCAKNSENNPADYSNYSVSQVLPLLSLIDSADGAGDFPALVNALSMAVRVQRALGKDLVALRSYMEQAGKYVVAVESSSEAMDKLAAAYGRTMDYLSAAGVGITLEKQKDATGIIITEVRPDMPGDRAGILYGDVILAIDGVPVDGMSAEDASSLIIGEIGATVTLSVLRSGHTIDIKLSRAPLVNMEDGRRTEIIGAITAIRSFILQAGQHCTDDVSDLKSIARKLEQESTENQRIEAAFSDLTSRLENLLTILVKDRPELIAFTRQSLAESPEALNLFDRFVVLLNEQKSNGGTNSDWMERMQKLDQEQEAFEKKSDASDLDKNTLRLSIITLGKLDSMHVSTKGRLRIVKNAASSSARAPDSDQTAKDLAALAVRLDNWRAKMVTDAAKIESLEGGRDFYANYVRTLADLNLPEQALVASETARARAFQDLLAARVVDFPANQGKSSGKLFLPNPASVPPITLDEILSIAREGESTLIEYFTTDEELFIWIVSPHGTINMIRRPLRMDVLKHSINEFVELVEPVQCSPQEKQAREHRLKEILANLHVQLIEPIPPDFLPNVPDELYEKAGPVTLVPYGDLFRVPFNVLMDKDGKYFIEKYAPVFSAAISILRYTHENKKKVSSSDSAKLLAVVNPKPLPESAFSTLNEMENGLPRLLKFFPESGNDDVLLGGDASKENLKNRLQDRKYSVIFFGTHGAINDKDVLNSYVALAKIDGMGQSEDGRLKISEIFGLKVQSDLSILAACGSGRGAVSADGVNGLSRAFVWGGTASLLTSLWSIPERLSFQQIYEFSRYWREEGMDKANALRMTQLNFLEYYPEQPETWAGFQLYGEWK